MTVRSTPMPPMGNPIDAAIKYKEKNGCPEINLMPRERNKLKNMSAQTNSPSPQMAAPVRFRIREVCSSRQVSSAKLGVRPMASNGSEGRI